MAKNRHFWSRGYYVSTVGRNKQAAQKYIQNQEKVNLISVQISIPAFSQICILTAKRGNAIIKTRR